MTMTHQGDVMSVKAESGPMGSFHNVPGRMYGFIERGGQLQQLAGFLDLSKRYCTWKPTLVYVHGPPGAGKSSLVSEFLYQNREKLGDHQVIWLAGGSIHDQMINLCETKPQLHGIVTRRGNGDLVKNKLLVDEVFDMLCFYPSIIVVDGITKDEAKIDDYIGYVHKSRRSDKKYPLCIVISRESQISAGGSYIRVKVDPLSEDSFVIPTAIEKRFAKEEILEIAKFSGFHPAFSKILRGCAIHLCESDGSLEKLIEFLINLVLKHTSPDAFSRPFDFPLKLKAIWGCLINSLAQSDEVGRTAVEILRASILLPKTGASVDLALDLFCKYFQLKHEDDGRDEPNQLPLKDLLRKALLLLQDFGLIEGADSAYISPLLCEYLESQLRSDKTEFQLHILRLAKLLLASVSPNSVTASSLNDSTACYLACIARVSQWVAELDKSDESIAVKLQFARLLAHRVPSLALILTDDLEDKDETGITFTEQDRIIAEVRSRAYRNMVRPAESVQTLKKACARAIECHGLENRDVVLLRRELAEALYWDGKCKEALSEIENLLETNLLSEEEQLGVRTDQAYYCYKAGESDRAVDIMDQVYQASRKLFGEEHEFTANRLKDLQHYKMKLGNYKECLHLAKKTAKAFANIYGQDHHDTFLSRRWVFECMLKLETGNCLQVLPEAKKLWKYEEKEHGSCHRYTVEVMNLLVLLILKASSQQDMKPGKWKMNAFEALELAISSWETRERMFGQDFVFTIRSKCLVAKARLHLGHLHEARDLIMQIDKTLDRLFNPHQRSNILRIRNIFRDHEINKKELRALEARHGGHQKRSADTNWRV